MNMLTMPADLLIIQDGQKVYIGRPAQPVDEQVKSRIAMAIAETGIVHESHLPHVYIPDLMTTAGPVLFVRTNVDLDQVSKAVEKIVASAPEIQLYVLPLSERSPLWAMVRDQQCQLT